MILRGEEQERSQPLKVTALNGVLHITEATQTLIIMCKVAMHEDFFLLYALDGGAGRGGFGAVIGSKCLPNTSRHKYLIRTAF